MTQPSITNSRLCNYGCGIQIYWNNSKRAFVEVETGNKHFCQARKPTTGVNKIFVPPSNTNAQVNRPTFTTGTGRPYTTQQQQQKHSSNSIQVLKGSELEVQKQYENLADIVTELGGRIHGSQSHYLNSSVDSAEQKNGLELRIVVYYEVPAGSGSANAENRELVKSRFLLR